MVCASLENAKTHLKFLFLVNMERTINT